MYPDPVIITQITNFFFVQTLFNYLRQKKSFFVGKIDPPKKYSLTNKVAYTKICEVQDRT
jgi:hypothetical protein